MSQFFITSLIFGPIAGAGIGLEFMSFSKVLLYQILIQIGTISVLFAICRKCNVIGKRNKKNDIVDFIYNFFEIKRKIKVSQDMLNKIEKRLEKRKGFTYIGFYISVALMTFLMGIPLVFIAIYLLRLPRQKSFVAMSLGAIFASYVWTSVVYGSLTFVTPDQIIVIVFSFILASILLNKFKENKILKEIVEEVTDIMKV